MSEFLRPKGSAVCIAQANGLGTQITQRRLGPTAQPFVITINPKHTVHQYRSHLVFSTKDRRPFLQTESMLDIIDEYIRSQDSHHVK